MKKIRFSDCHPERVHSAKGLCKECYRKLLIARNPQVAIANRARAKRWKENNQERYALLGKAKHLRRKFGITLIEYQNLLDSQRGVCFLCKNPEKIKNHISKKTSSLAVDHCHKTGKIRGLLCFKCNTTIAHIENNPDIYQIIRGYLALQESE